MKSVIKNIRNLLDDAEDLIVQLEIENKGLKAKIEHQTGAPLRDVEPDYKKQRDILLLAMQKASERLNKNDPKERSIKSGIDSALKSIH